MRFRLIASVLLAATFVVHERRVDAQDYRARLQGIVTDSSQAVIPGASVTLRNLNTGVQTVRHTNETGRYVFDYVEPGAYTLTVHLDGFSTFVQQNIDVQSRGDVTVNAVLTPGTLQETVTVTDSPVAVQFNTPACCSRWIRSSPTSCPASTATRSSSRCSTRLRSTRAGR